LPYMYKLKWLKLLSPLVQRFLQWNNEEKIIVKEFIINWQKQ
jgi:hypothetical protein